MSNKPEPKRDKPITQRKSGHKGKACRRGKGVCYDEVKKSINLSLIPTAIARLEGLAASQQCSQSETIERLIRALL
jgi:hypothetical protein